MAATTKAGIRVLAPAAALAAVALSAWPVLAADVFAGREIYVTHCETCHGKDGRPVDPGTPDFARGERLFAGDGELFRRVRSGTGAMPAYRGLLSDDEIRDVIAYLRSLQR